MGETYRMTDKIIRFLGRYTGLEDDDARLALEFGSQVSAIEVLDKAHRGIDVRFPYLVPARFK